MRFVHLVRLITVLLTAVGCFVSTPIVWLAWLEMRLGFSPAIYETGYSYLTAIVELGVYLASAAAVVLVFIAVPRRRWGAPGVASCFLLIGACLLVDLTGCYSERFISGALIPIGCYARQVWFALPPVLFGAFLSCPFVQERLRSSPMVVATNV